MAQRAKVPIVPVAMDGSYLLWENNNNKIKPCKIYIRVLKPIYDVDKMPRKEFRHITEAVRKKIQTELDVIKYIREKDENKQ